jgi:two-component system, LytTR family, response regulator
MWALCSRHSSTNADDVPVRHLEVDDDKTRQGDWASEDGDFLAGRLFVRDVRGAIVPVPLEHVERLEAQDDYVGVVTRERRYLISARLGEMAEQLRGRSFLRVHRSHVVNLDYVDRMVPYDAKRLEVRMRDGTCILASRSASEMIRRRAR